MSERTTAARLVAAGLLVCGLAMCCRAPTVPDPANGIDAPCVSMQAPDSGAWGLWCPTERMQQVVDQLEQAKKQASACCAATPCPLDLYILDKQDGG